jgi:hypothetical protein
MKNGIAAPPQSLLMEEIGIPDSTVGWIFISINRRD